MPSSLAPAAGDSSGRKFLSIKVFRPYSYTMTSSSAQEVLLTPGEVARLFRVDPKTVSRWAKTGKITAIRTLGGHRRYRRSEVQALLGIDAKEIKGV